MFRDIAGDSNGMNMENNMDSGRDYEYRSRGNYQYQLEAFVRYLYNTGIKQRSLDQSIGGCLYKSVADVLPTFHCARQEMHTEALYFLGSVAELKFPPSIPHYKV